MKPMWGYRLEETPSEADRVLFTELGHPEVLEQQLYWLREERVEFESFEMFTQVDVAYVVHDHIYVEPTLAQRLKDGTVIVTETQLEKHL